MFLLNNFIVSNDNLTHVQLCTTCVENILCLIFVVSDDSDNFLITKISQITGDDNYWRTVMVMTGCVDAFSVSRTVKSEHLTVPSITAFPT